MNGHLLFHLSLIFTSLTILFPELKIDPLAYCIFSIKALNKKYSKTHLYTMFRNLVRPTINPIFRIVSEVQKIFLDFCFIPFYLHLSWILKCAKNKFHFKVPFHDERFTKCRSHIQMSISR